MSAKFFHIAFNFKAGGSHITELKPIIDLAVDWYRYAPNCWLVYSTSTAQKWFERLEPKLSSSDSVFICEIDITNRSGKMPKGAWDWLQKDRDESE